MKEVKVYAPATVANVVCGFDILGFALSQPHDQMVVRISDKKGVTIINKDAYDLPTDATRNVAGVALLALMHSLVLRQIRRNVRRVVARDALVRFVARVDRGVGLDVAPGVARVPAPRALEPRAASVPDLLHHNGLHTRAGLAAVDGRARRAVGNPRRTQ